MLMTRPKHTTTNAALAAWTALVPPGLLGANKLKDEHGAAESLMKLCTEPRPPACIEGTEAIRRTWRQQRYRGHTDPLTFGQDLLDEAKANAVRLITPDTPEWPQLSLAPEITPAALWAQGNLTLTEAIQRGVTVTGTTAATDIGSRIAHDITTHLSTNDYVIWAPTTPGIAATVHHTCHTRNHPTPCVGFADSSLNTIHPQRFSPAKNRLLLSEAPFNTTRPSALYGTRRDWLLAEFTLATIAAETLHQCHATQTLRRAASLGKPAGICLASPSPGLGNILTNSTIHPLANTADLDALIANTKPHTTPV